MDAEGAITHCIVAVTFRDVVSVSRHSRELTTSRSRLGQSAQRLGLGPICLGPRLGLGPKLLGVSSRAISCRWLRHFVRRTCCVAQYSRRRPIQTNLL